MITHSNGIVLIVLLIALWWLYRQYKHIGVAHALACIAYAMTFSADITRMREIRATKADKLSKFKAVNDIALDALADAQAAKDQMFDSIAGWRGFLARRIF